MRRSRGCSQPLQQMVEGHGYNLCGPQGARASGQTARVLWGFLDLVALSHTLPGEWAFTLLCATLARGPGGSHNCLPAEPWLRFKSRGNCFGRWALGRLRRRGLTQGAALVWSHYTRPPPHPSSPRQLPGFLGGTLIHQ